MKRFIIEVAQANLYFKGHEVNLAFTVTPYKKHAALFGTIQAAHTERFVLDVAYPNMRFDVVEVEPAIFGG